MRRSIGTAIFLVTAVVLLVGFAGCLSLPSVQDWVARRTLEFEDATIAWATDDENTGDDVSIMQVATDTPTPTSTPTPTTTPTASPTPDCHIVEVLGSMDVPTPSPCIDWNGRSRCGANDEFVEIYCVTESILSDWTMSDDTCSYTFSGDNLTGPLKAIWSDWMTIVGGDTCTGFELGTTWTLTNTLGTPVSTRAVPTVATPGNSWGAVNYATPGGSWSEGTPSPGTGP